MAVPDNFKKSIYSIEFQKRLGIVVKEKNTSLRQICLKLDLSNSFFAAQRDFNVRSIAKLCNLYPDINVSWLIMGEGTPFPSADTNNVLAEPTTNISEIESMVEKFLKMIQQKDEQIKNTIESNQYAMQLLENKVKALEAELATK